jgi:hypothetical protein
VPEALDPDIFPEAAAEAAAAGLPQELVAAAFVARAERLFPRACAEAGVVDEPVRGALLRLLVSTCLIWFKHTLEQVRGAWVS